MDVLPVAIAGKNSTDTSDDAAWRDAKPTFELLTSSARNTSTRGKREIERERYGESTHGIVDVSEGGILF